MAAGRAYGIRPAGMLALDVVRLEAGLLLLEVDYTSARHALKPEQNYSPYELGLGRLVDLDKAADFVGRRHSTRAGRPAARRAGSSACSSTGTASSAFSAQGLPPAISASSVAASPCPCTPAGARSASDEPRLEPDPQAGDRARLGCARARARGRSSQVEWTVEGHRGRVGATVVPLPFLDLPRRRG